uniref:Uncharacterized protein n=1 Tax=Caenorhabditis tropicalis TaxID=1561998 RepID=A0A1I7TXL4_9PELO
MKDLELQPLVKSDDEILEEHSNDAWTPEYLYSQEFDALFQKLFNEYLHGEFSQIGDQTDFDAFRRMFISLKEKRNELEDKFFPGKVGERVEKNETETEEEIQECYDKLQKLTTKKEDQENGFSWKRLLFGCVGRREKEAEEKKRMNLFNY